MSAVLNPLNELMVDANQESAEDNTSTPTLEEAPYCGDATHAKAIALKFAKSIWRATADNNVTAVIELTRMLATAMAAWQDTSFDEDVRDTTLALADSMADAIVYHRTAIAHALRKPLRIAMVFVGLHTKMPPRAEMPL